ncbi:MAG: hypothetical protein U5K27_02050 [Desulfotignum sp.]|nr:hypothetical protein [Desulfotignum sp.]
MTDIDHFSLGTVFAKTVAGAVSDDFLAIFSSMGSALIVFGSTTGNTEFAATIPGTFFIKPCRKISAIFWSRVTPQSETT